MQGMVLHDAGCFSGAGIGGLARDGGPGGGLIALSTTCRSNAFAIAPDSIRVHVV